MRVVMMRFTVRSHSESRPLNKVRISSTSKLRIPIVTLVKLHDRPIWERPYSRSTKTVSLSIWDQVLPNLHEQQQMLKTHLSRSAQWNLLAELSQSLNTLHDQYQQYLKSLNEATKFWTLSDLKGDHSMVYRLHSHCREPRKRISLVWWLKTSWNLNVRDWLQRCKDWKFKMRWMKKRLRNEIRSSTI